MLPSIGGKWHCQKENDVVASLAPLLHLLYSSSFLRIQNTCSENEQNLEVQRKTIAYTQADLQNSSLKLVISMVFTTEPRMGATIIQCQPLLLVVVSARCTNLLLISNSFCQSLKNHRLSSIFPLVTSVQVSRPVTINIFVIWNRHLKLPFTEIQTWAKHAALCWRFPQ